MARLPVLPTRGWTLIVPREGSDASAQAGGGSGGLQISLRDDPDIIRKRLEE